MDKEKVLALAKLSRISIEETEAENLSHEFETILNYVGEIKKAEGEEVKKKPHNYPVRNILREDVVTTESGSYTQAILDQAPKREGDYLKVKNIL